MNAMQARHRVGVLGATGVVGQRLVERLAAHPWFELVGLGASERTAGRPYDRTVRWTLAGSPPPIVAGRILRPCRPAEFADCDLLLSALDTAAALEVEPRFAEAGFPVISNSAAFRLDEDVPLLVPEINADHVALVEIQRARRGTRGFVVTNPNCSATGLALALAPLHRAFGLRRLVVATLQAISGAGLDGPRALDLLDNVIPHVPGEEPKLEHEVARILGRLDAGGVVPAPVVVSAHCHRVGVLDGHLEAASIELSRPVSPEEAIESLRAFRGATEALDLPSGVRPLLVVRDEPDRPQPRLDRDTGGGMAVVIGRVRPCPALGLKLELLSHNTVRGAAGGTLLNAELLAARGLLSRRIAA
jgi:aspartate-semialdehyde dehydrogenase